MSTVQVPRSLHNVQLGTEVETNIRVVRCFEGSGVSCRRVKIHSAVWSDDLRQTVCSILRHRDGLVAAPSPFLTDEIIVLGTKKVETADVTHENWRARIQTDTENLLLRIDKESDRQALLELIEKALVAQFQRSNQYWRLRTSTRFWFKTTPEETIKGIEMIPRISFATLPIGNDAIGIAFDLGHLFRTSMTLADFYDPTIGQREQSERRHEFDALSSRMKGRKGTLLYHSGSRTLDVCYFDHFAEEVTCKTTGPLSVQGKSYNSLYDYYDKCRPGLKVAPDDSVAYVSFKGLPSAKPVAARLLRLRVGLDEKQLPPEFKRKTVVAPEPRSRIAKETWKNHGRKAVFPFRVDVAPFLWRPANNEHELLPCPDLIFDKGHVLRAPNEPNLEEYKRYYRERLEFLRNGHLYHYDEAVPRHVHIVTPKESDRWSKNLHDKFIEDFLNCIASMTKLNFTAKQLRADSTDEIVERLEACRSGTAVVVFDKADSEGEAYYLLAHELKGWRLKRLTRQEVEGKWVTLQKSSAPRDRQKSERRWRDIIELSVLDTLDQMGTIPWRLRSFPYDACIAIDVGKDRRYWAMSLLICREETFNPSFIRITEVWPKGDHYHEAINPEVLKDKISKICRQFQKESAYRFSPLRSLLILRDGHECGDELKAIDMAMEFWSSNGYLIKSPKIDIADVHKKTVKGLKIWYPLKADYSNVLEGHAVYFGNETALVCCTGASSVLSRATADPSLLVCRRSDDIRSVAKAYFWLSQLNYSTPAKAHRLPLPLRETDSELKHRMAQDMRGIK